MKKSEKLIFIVLCALFVVPLWIVKYVPIQDYPSHLLFTNILKNYHDPVLGYNNIFILTYPLAPNLIFQIVTATLSYLFPLMIAGKIFLSLCVMGLPLSLLYLLDTAKRKDHILAFLGFLFSYSWFLNLGLLNYVASLIMFSFALGYWLRYKKQFNGTRSVIFILLTTLLYFSHLMSYALLVGIMLIDSFKEKSSRKSLPLLVPTILLTLCYFVFSRKFSGSWDLSYYGLAADFRTLLLPVFSYVPRMTNLIFLSACLLVLILSVYSVRSDCRNTWRSTNFLVFAGLIILYFISPYHFSEWGYVKVRILPYVFIFLLLFIGFPNHPYAKKIFLVCVTLLSLSSLFSTTSSYRKIDRYLQNYASILDRIPPQKTLFPIPKQGKYFLMPTLHFESYYHIFKGGRSPNIFPGPFGIIALKERLPSVDPGTLKQFEKISHLYDYVVMVGEHPKLHSKLTPRYRLGEQKGDFSLFVRNDEYVHFLKYRNRQNHGSAL